MARYIQAILSKEINELEEKQDNCTITESEQRRLEYLKWRYANPVTDWSNPVNV